MTTFFLFDTGSAKVADYNSTAPTIDLVGRPRHPRNRSRLGNLGSGGGTTSRRSSRPAERTTTLRTSSLPHGPTVAWAADALLPNVIAFTPGTVALWDPWFDVQNGKGIIEDIASNIIKMIVNQDFSSGLKAEAGPRLLPLPFSSPGQLT